MRQSAPELSSNLDRTRRLCDTRGRLFLDLMSSSVGGKSSSRTSCICIDITASTLAELRQAELRVATLSVELRPHSTTQREKGALYIMIQMAAHAIFCNSTHVVNKRTIRIHVKACPEKAYAAAGTSKKFHEHMELIASKEGEARWKTRNGQDIVR